MIRISSYEDFIDKLQKNTMVSFRDIGGYEVTLDQIERVINQYAVLYEPSRTKIDNSSHLPLPQKIIHSLFRNEQKTDFDTLLNSGIEPSSVLLRWTNNNSG